MDPFDLIWTIKCAAYFGVGFDWPRPAQPPHRMSHTNRDSFLPLQFSISVFGSQELLHVP